MVAIGHAIERKDALIQMLALKGHRHRAMVEERWLGLYVTWYQELLVKVRNAADAEMARYLDQLKRQIPYLASDSLDQESAPRELQPEIAAIYQQMQSAEIKHKQLTTRDAGIR